MRVKDKEFMGAVLNRHSNDVSITVTNRGNKPYAITISLKHDIVPLLTDPNRLSVLLFGNRVYFKSDSNGFKVNDRGCKSVYVAINNFEARGISLKKAKSFIGDYELKWDEEEELYYVEKPDNR